MRLSKVEIEVCDICGKTHEKMRRLFRGTVCDKCYQLLNDRNQLLVCVKDRVGKTYNRLKAFEELGLDAAEIKKYLSKVEALLKEEDNPFETVKTQIIGNFDVISKLETTLIFANIDELTNQMQQANIALIEENENLKKQTESVEKDKVEMSGRISNLSKEIEGLNETTNTLTNENKEFKNQINQLEDLKGKKVEYENQINRLNKEIEELNKKIKGLKNKEETEKLVNNPFYLGTYPVTQREWEAVMGDRPSDFKGDDLPVEQVSWDDVQKFIKKLNEKEGTDKYRLPSEAEWEYAYRAGTTTRYSFGDSESKLGDYAWYRDNSGEKTHPAGQKESNSWGLYDMHGNVWEWVQDGWHDSYDGAPTDGSARESGDGADRVFRGGSWSSNAGGCRSAFRGRRDPRPRSSLLGFRILQEV
jgi:formylglycine-generating enzyme required for sulfatase activity